MQHTPDIPCSDPRHELIELLFREQCSCVVRSADTIRIFRERGVSDLYRLLSEEPDFLHGAAVADKVVGKGAAALMILGGVELLYADIISRGALEMALSHGLKVSYSLMVDHIINRRGDDWCPVEKRCRKLRDPQECLPEIRDFLLSQTRK